MQAKRFVAADMRRALDMVKEEFGEEAMILSTERTSKGVELVARGEASLSQHDPILQEQPNPHEQQLQQAAEKIASTGAATTSSIDRDFVRDTRANNHASLQRSATRINKGLASGKTPDELAAEMEFANRKMLAAKKAQNAPIGEWAEREWAEREGVGREDVERENAFSQNIESEGRLAARNEAHWNETHKTQPQTNYSQQREQGAVNNPSHDEEEIRHLKDEIANMRESLELQLMYMTENQERHYSEASDEQVNLSTLTRLPAVKNIRQQLDLLGLTRACNDQLINTISAEKAVNNRQALWTEVLACLARTIPCDTSDRVAKGGVFACLGTTGVGKTTTIAKLAARYVMDHGSDSVVLLTTDTYRIASHNQLKSLAKILNVRIEVIESLDQLPIMVSSLSHYPLVLIDTPGMGHADPLLKHHLRVLEQCQQLEKIIVLAATSQYQMMRATLHSYGSKGLDACVLTKLDECAHLGDAMSLLSEQDLPLAYVTDGQSVPDDIDIFKSTQLVKRAVLLLKQQKNHALHA